MADAREPRPTERASVAAANVICFDLMSMVCDDCAAEVKRKATTFPIMLQVNIPYNPSVRFKIHDGPDAKARFDEFVDECMVKAKKWAEEDNQE